MASGTTGRRIRAWARDIKRDVVALWLAARDPRVPVAAKIVSGIVAAYALSPIDLIPDFIPVIGYLDDVILVPLGILLAIRLIPARVMAQLREQALKVGRPRSAAGLVAILLVWIAGVTALGWWLWGRMPG